MPNGGWPLWAPAPASWRCSTCSTGSSPAERSPTSATRHAEPGRCSSPWNAGRRRRPALAHPWGRDRMRGQATTSPSRSCSATYTTSTSGWGPRQGPSSSSTLAGRRPPRKTRRARQEVVDEERRGMGRSLHTHGLAALLARNLEHPRWDDVAERAMVIPKLAASMVEGTTATARWPASRWSQPGRLGSGSNSSRSRWWPSVHRR